MKSMKDMDKMDALASEYVMGLLSAEEALVVENELASNAQLTKQVRYWRERLLPLAISAPEITPSSDLWAKINTQINLFAPARRKRAMPFLRHFKTKAIENYGVTFAIAASLFFVALPILRDNFMPQKRTGVAILTDDKANIGALVEIYGQKKIVLVAMANIDVPADKSLQVWTLQDKAVGPKSLGIMENVKGGEFKTPVMPSPTANQLYEITLEPKGGSPLNRPTGPILYKGLAQLN